MTLPEIERRIASAEVELEALRAERDRLAAEEADLGPTPARR